MREELGIGSVDGVGRRGGIAGAEVERGTISGGEGLSSGRPDMAAMIAQA